MLFGQGKSILKTSRYKNSTALSAWLCVEADTFRSLAIMRQKRRHILHSHVTRMVHAAGLEGTPADEKLHPAQIGFLGLEAIVQIPNPLAHLIEKAG